MEQMSKHEVWKDIEGYEGLYQVSNTGRVRSLNYKRQNKIKTLKLFKTYRGYYRVSLIKDKKKKDVFIHRLVAKAFLNSIPEKTYVYDKNGNKVDNSVTNLEWCTQSENIKHAYDTGLKMKYFGKKHWNYKNGKYVKVEVTNEH